jgi:hypothetical protein
VTIKNEVQLELDVEEIFEQSAMLIGSGMLEAVRRNDPVQGRALDRLIEDGARLVVSFITGDDPAIETSILDEAGTAITIATKRIERPDLQ